MSRKQDTTLRELSLLDRRQKIPVGEAAVYNDLSEATFRRHYKHLIHQISARRQAVTVGDAIDLPPAQPAPVASPMAAATTRKLARKPITKRRSIAGPAPASS